MNDPTDQEQRASALAIESPVNPDGKGLSGIMLDWYRTAPRDVVAKPRRQILSELFTSMLVLSAAFKYRPVVGAENYLYWINGEWSLSLIAPDEWSKQRRAGYAGMCVLHPDMTWTIAPTEGLTEENPVSEAIGRFYGAFVEKLDTDLTLEEILPFYTHSLPYYPRLHASALSRSMRTAMKLGDQTSTTCREWRSLLPKKQDELLVHKSADSLINSVDR